MAAPGEAAKRTRADELLGRREARGHQVHADPAALHRMHVARSAVAGTRAIADSWRAVLFKQHCHSLREYSRRRVYTRALKPDIDANVAGGEKGFAGGSRGRLNTATKEKPTITSAPHSDKGM